MPATLAQPICPGLRKPHPHLDAVIEFDDLKGFDVFSRQHDAFAKAESNREIPEVLRRGHHDGIGAAIVGESDRGLSRDPPRAFADAAIAPDLTIDGANRIAHDYSAASTTGAMRREWRACSSYAFGHADGPFDGEICTAVTLYSGQLVAQSEKSVVMTLACVSGWWKVVYTTPGATRSVISASSVGSP